MGEGPSKLCPSIFAVGSKSADIRPQPPAEPAAAAGPGPADAEVVIATLNPHRASTYKSLLLEFGCRVHVVRDGEEAQHLIGRIGVPQLLIADVSLPKVDGISLVRQLRSGASAGRMGAILVASHDALRSLARDAADSLGVARVLPIDADRTSLREAILDTLPLPEDAAAPRSEVAAVPAACTDSPGDVLDQAVFDAVRRFSVPIAVAYLRVDGRERVAAHVAATDPLGSAIELPSIALLRQLAGAPEPLILPNLETHAFDSSFSLSRSGLVRGFAGVAMTLEGEDAAGSVCLLDTRPLALDAADLDALVVFVRELARAAEHRGPHLVSAAKNRGGVTADEIETLERLAVTDPLTGLANRRGGESKIASEISRARRQNAPLSCILLDIDRFKDVNDTHGHQAGDHLLREISSLLRRTVRAYDILVRWGGEEFLIVLPGVDLDQARRLAERLRHAVETLEARGVGPVTVSAGAATLDTDYNFDAMLAEADRRLYQAKSAGRNCIA